jgi:hypothetical protein
VRRMTADKVETNRMKPCTEVHFGLIDPARTGRRDHSFAPAAWSRSVCTQALSVGLCRRAARKQGGTAARSADYRARRADARGDGHHAASPRREQPARRVAGTAGRAGQHWRGFNILALVRPSTPVTGAGLLSCAQISLGRLRRGSARLQDKRVARPGVLGERIDRGLRRQPGTERREHAKCPRT